MNNLQGKRAILYRRVITTEQKINGNSLKAQQHNLKTFCSQKGIIVKREFEEDYFAKDFAVDDFSQNQLLKIVKYKPLRLSKSNLSRLLKNEVYTGYIRIKAFNNDPEETVKGLHQPIIDSNTFEKVQYQLKQRSRFKPKSNKYNEKLPLRRQLK